MPGRIEAKLAELGITLPTPDGSRSPITCPMW